MTARFKQHLQSGQVQVGMWLAVSSVESGAVMHSSGFDWCLVDGDGYNASFNGLSAQGCVPVFQASSESLGLGEANKLFNWPIILPVKSARQAIGIKKNRALRVGPETDICLLGLISTTSALKELGAILATNALDAIILDTAGLAADMGFASSPSCGSVQTVIDNAAQQLKLDDVPFGVVVFDPFQVPRHLDQGSVFLAVGGDAILAAKRLIPLGQEPELVQD